MDWLCLNSYRRQSRINGLLSTGATCWSATDYYSILMAQTIFLNCLLFWYLKTLILHTLWSQIQDTSLCLWFVTLFSGPFFLHHFVVKTNFGYSTWRDFMNSNQIARPVSVLISNLKRNKVLEKSVSNRRHVSCIRDQRVRKFLSGGKTKILFLLLLKKTKLLVFLMALSFHPIH